MQISVLTPDRAIFTGAIKSITVPGAGGRFQILENHAPIVSALAKGRVEIVTAAGEHELYNAEAGKSEKSSATDRVIQFEVGGGFVEVLKNEISLLVQGVQLS